MDSIEMNDCLIGNGLMICQTEGKVAECCCQKGPKPTFESALERYKKKREARAKAGGKLCTTLE